MEPKIFKKNNHLAHGIPEGREVQKKKKVRYVLGTYRHRYHYGAGPYRHSNSLSNTVKESSTDTLIVCGTNYRVSIWAGPRKLVPVPQEKLNKHETALPLINLFIPFNRLPNRHVIYPIPKMYFFHDLNKTYLKITRNSNNHFLNAILKF